MLRLGELRSRPLHFITTANVVIAVVAAGSYCLAGLLDWPLFTMGPRNGALFLAALVLLSTAVIFLWMRWGPIPLFHIGSRPWLYFGGQLGLVAANVVLLGGVVMAFAAASISREEAYWCEMGLKQYIGPVGGALAVVSIISILLGTPTFAKR